MSAPLLVTKLYLPPTRPETVLRPRLIARLNEGLRRRLTVVAAPAGFGKTTLVAAWVNGSSQPVAWLSLDAGDSDPARFLAYLVAALQTVVPRLGAGVLDALQAPQPPPSEALLTTLLNEIAAFPDQLILVLDDYHLITAQPVHLALAFLVEHLPPQLHLVIATREDPPLPLARLRARGQLTELRAADLRFTAAEADNFLNAAMGLDLAAADVAALGGRAEGWIAGLQLAALSLQGRADATAFIEAFAGDDRYIVDYLVEEVLQRQPAAVRSFLLDTAVLTRLSGPLCEAVTGQGGGNARLEALARGNFFLVPLDDRRHWYRYHHLFADVLRAHLLDEQPDRVPDLHRRASAWHEEAGEPTEAIRHALVAGDHARAADLIELAAPAMARSRQEVTLRGWLEALPAALLRRRPVLSVGYAHMLLDRGELTGVDDLLRDAEQWLDTRTNSAEQPDDPAGMVIVDQAAFARLPGAIAVARAGQALALGDLTATLHHARRVLALVPTDDHLGRGGAAGFLGLAAWASGDLDEAHRAYATGMAHLQQAGNSADVIGGAVVLGDIRLAQGRLNEAWRTYEQGLQRAAELGTPTMRGTADLHVGLSEILRERDDRPAAMRHLLRSQEQGEQTGLPAHPYRWRVAMARLREAEGDPDGALTLLHEAERRYVRDFSPDIRPLAALQARVWLTQGRLDDALAWVRERGLSAADDFNYLREFEHLTLARVLLAQARGNGARRASLEALELLARLLAAAEVGARTGSVVEILILQALAHQISGDLAAALVPLARALKLAEPEGYVRIFLDEGPPLATLLTAAAQRGVMPQYIRLLLAGFGRAEDTTPANKDMIEPLSDRELDVLRLLGTDLSGPAIADELMVSLNTMRTHTKNIYGKLGVNSRRKAVSKAIELALLSRAHRH